MSMYSTALVTAPDMETSRRISRHVVEMRLAACANLFQIRSIYRWKGEINEEGEYGILFKIRDSDFESLKEEVLRVHPYEVPCVVRYPIAEGNQPYLEWIGESTER